MWIICLKFLKFVIFSHIFFSEILPLIEFQLESDISDSDAIKLILSSYDENKSKASQNKSQNINTLILDEENQDLTVDPFTFKLMNFEVNITKFYF